MPPHKPCPEWCIGALQSGRVPKVESFNASTPTHAAFFIGEAGASSPMVVTTQHHLKVPVGACPNSGQGLGGGNHPFESLNAIIMILGCVAGPMIMLIFTRLPLLCFQLNPQLSKMLHEYQKKLKALTSLCQRQSSDYAMYVPPPQPGIAFSTLIVAHPPLHTHAPLLINFAALLKKSAVEKA